ncbi:TetR/AcrR family transcriptional regulator [Leucobacter massiliensis]|uniref:TetR/AcrR family transcriptional regulator n=1 Tax=Leucobacter massiliensis TaxID=1686285 RepID=UPI001FE88008|nr:TetR family transcriptional regulator [Leucobacter massiliensis]
MTTPATPRRRDPEARRREILAAAAELIVEDGVAALTHRAIAARAGVPLGSTTQHFASIDALREAALQQLSDEIDEELAAMEPHLRDLIADPDRATRDLLGYLHETRVVQADIALMTTGVTDARLRPLALRWSDRLIEMLSPHIGPARAVAIAAYIDGVTVHAGLHEHPLPHHEIAAALRALAAMPLDGDPGDPGSVPGPPWPTAGDPPQDPGRAQDPEQQQDPEQPQDPERLQGPR